MRLPSGRTEGTRSWSLCGSCEFRSPESADRTSHRAAGNADGHENDRADDHAEGVGRNPEQVQAVLGDRDKSQAQNGAEQRTAPAAEPGAAKDDGGKDL